jgi:hypothetical protein
MAFRDSGPHSHRPRMRAARSPRGRRRPPGLSSGERCRSSTRSCAPRPGRASTAGHAVRGAPAGRCALTPRRKWFKRYALRGRRLSTTRHPARFKRSSTRKAGGGAMAPRLVSDNSPLSDATRSVPAFRLARGDAQGTRRQAEERPQHPRSIAAGDCEPAEITAPYLLKLERGQVATPSPHVLGRLGIVLESLRAPRSLRPAHGPEPRGGNRIQNRYFPSG